MTERDQAGKPSLSRRIALHGAEYLLLIWVSLVHMLAVSFLLVSGPDPESLAEAIKAAGDGARDMTGLVAFVAGPSMVLYMAATWMRRP